MSLLLAAALMAVGLAAAPATYAGGPVSSAPFSRFMDNMGRDIMPVQSGQALPLRVLIARVQQQRGGTFIDVLGGLEERNGRPFYIFRWRYPSGVEENLIVDAATGQVIG